MPYDVELAGCSPVPIASYLKALAVLRLVAEQADPDARGFWIDAGFVLRSDLDTSRLRRFFLDQYRPSAIVAPWNGGSGFYPNDNTSALDAIVAGAANRFTLVRETILAARELVSRFGLKESPKDQTQKAVFLENVRSLVVDEALTWMDAAVVLSAENPSYPPLLGTGGNDVRLDFTNNFLQRLVELFDPNTGAPRTEAAGWLEGSLSGTPIPGLQSCAIGQFEPGAAGGPNASTGFKGDPLVNPWNFVFSLEGSLVLTAAATRRLESTLKGAWAYPFTVKPTAAGSGATSLCDEGEGARGEIWLPVWKSAASYREIAALFREGRATVVRRTAADGFDFRRAVASLGVERGIDSFTRYSFTKRAGRAHLATPLSHVRVEREPRDSLLIELDREGYLERLRRTARRDGCPVALRAKVRRLEEAIFTLLGCATPRSTAVQDVLMRLAVVERAVSSSRFAREEAGLRPAPWLSERWAIEADDRTDEFRLAASLAGLTWNPCPFRAHVTPVVASDRHDWEAIEWKPGSSLATFGFGASDGLLVSTLDRRLLFATRYSRDDEIPRRAMDPLDGRCSTDLAALGAFVRGDVDHARLVNLAAGLSLVKVPVRLERREPEIGAQAVLPASLAILVTAFTPARLLSQRTILPPDATLVRSRRIISCLLAERIDEATAIAWRSLRLAGMKLPSFPPDALNPRALHGERLAAALLFPLDPREVESLAKRLLVPLEAAPSTAN